LEGIETNEITPDMINKYLPQIEKHFPEIRKQLPQLQNYCLSHKLPKHKKIVKKYTKHCDDSELDCYEKIHKHCKPCVENSEPYNGYDFDTSNCIPVNHSADDNKYCPHKHHKLYSDEFVKLSAHGNNCKKYEKCKPCNDSSSESSSDSSSESSSKSCSDKHDKSSEDCNCYNNSTSDECSSDSNSSCSEKVDKNKKHCKKPTRPCDESNEIDDRIKKIKLQLDKLSDTHEEQCDDDSDCDDKEHIKHIGEIECREVTDEEEKSVSNWDLCEFKKICKPCKHECGQFAIDEDLCTFKNKVIKKAEIIISCYKKKLLECEENKCQLEKCLEKCKQKKIVSSKKNFINVIVI